MGEFKCLVLLLLAAVAVVENVDVSTPEALVFSGQVNIALLLDLHENNAKDGTKCSQINPMAVQKLMAALWTVQVLNSDRQQKDFTVGIHALDTCRQVDYSVRQAVRLATMVSGEQTCNQYKASQMILGAVNDADDSLIATQILNEFHLPNVITKSYVPSELRDGVTFSVEPSMVDIANAANSLLEKLQVSNAVSFYGTKDSDRTIWSKFVSSAGIKVQGSRLEDIKDYNLENKTVVLFVCLQEARQIFREFKFSAEYKATRWIIATTGGPTELPEGQEYFFYKNTLIIRPKTPSLENYVYYFNSAMNGTRRPRLPLLDEYLSQGYDKSVKKLDYGHFKVVTAVSSFVEAIREITRSNCHNGQKYCTRMFEESGKDMVFKSLVKLKKEFKVKQMPQLFGMELGFQQEERNFRNTKFQVLQYRFAEFKEIGTFSADMGLVGLQNELIKNWVHKEEIDVFNISSPVANSLLAPASFEFEDSENSSEIGGFSRIQQIFIERPIRLSKWVRRPTVWVTLTLSSIGLLSAIFVAVFISLKLCDGTIKRDQTIGIIQLLGVIGMFASAILFVVLKPSPFLCTYRQLLASISYSIVFSATIVRLMELHSLVSIGLGGRISRLNQYLTMMFIVGVQTALSIQRIFLKPETTVTNSTGIPQCSSIPLEFVVSHSYQILITILALLLAISARHINRNYNEAHCLLLASGMTLPTWIIWISMYMNLNDSHYRDMTVAMANVVFGTIILSVVFCAKLFVICKKPKDFREMKTSSSYAGSISTVFSNLNDFDTFSLGTISINGSIASRHSEKPFNISKGSSASMKLPKVIENTRANHKEEEEDGAVSINPLYEPINRTFQTFR